MSGHQTSSFFELKVGIYQRKPKVMVIVRCTIKVRRYDKAIHIMMNITNFKVHLYDTITMACIPSMFLHRVVVIWIYFLGCQITLYYSCSHMVWLILFIEWSVWIFLQPLDVYIKTWHGPLGVILWGMHKCHSNYMIIMCLYERKPHVCIELVKGNVLDAWIFSYQTSHVYKIGF